MSPSMNRDEAPGDTIVELSRRDLDEIIEMAAQRGAEKALSSIGLLEKTAADDVRELRSLLSIWKDMRATALRTFAQTATVALIGVIVLGISIKMGVLAVLSPDLPPKP